MRELGYRLYEFDGWTFSEVIAALKIYKREFKSLAVPVDFVMSEPVVKPGARLFNCPLGLIVKRLLDGWTKYQIACCR